MLQQNFNQCDTFSRSLIMFCLWLGLLLMPIWAPAQTASDSRHQEVLRELELTPAEERVFWPLYEGYSKALLLAFEETAEVAYRLFQVRGAVSEEMADEYSHALLNGELRLAQIHLEFQPQFRQVLGALRTARLLQFERRLQSYMSAEIAREFPLIR